MNIYSPRTKLTLENTVLGRNGADRPRQTRIPVSRSHLPSATARRIFNVVLRSGHFLFQGGEREWRVTPGHEFFYCLRGRGCVLSEKRLFRVDPFELAWLSGPTAYWADQAPWEILWMRVAGHHVEQTWEVLSVPQRPVFVGLPKETRRVFHRVNDLLAGGCSPADAALNCELAELLGHLVESRAGARTRALREPEAESPAISFAMEQMFGDLKRSWRAGELAKLCGLSERHFFRRFKREIGVSPIDWLRRERIRVAQRKLLDGAKRVKEVCDEVGYHDVFFFSRDFKRHTGSSPSDYRREHLRKRFPAAHCGPGNGHVEE
jgi:AraC-like DNA-binding protein